MNITTDGMTSYDVAERILNQTDWTQLSDSGLTSDCVTAWATYRTKLRDIPKDQKDKTTYASITWPSEPS